MSAPWMIFLSAIMFLTACASAETRLQVVAENDANQNTATELDFVWVFDEAALKMMPKSGPEWFAVKTSVRMALGTSIAVVSLSVPPGHAVDRVPYPAGHETAVALLVYANYLYSEGQTVLKLNQGRNCLVLKSTRVTMAAC